MVFLSSLAFWFRDSLGGFARFPRTLISLWEVWGGDECLLGVCYVLVAMTLCTPNSQPVAGSFWSLLATIPYHFISIISHQFGPSISLACILVSWLCAPSGHPINSCLMAIPTVHLASFQLVGLAICLAHSNLLRNAYWKKKRNAYWINESTCCQIFSGSLSL